MKLQRHHCNTQGSPVRPRALTSSHPPPHSPTSSLPGLPASLRLCQVPSHLRGFAPAVPSAGNTSPQMSAYLSARSLFQFHLLHEVFPGLNVQLPTWGFPFCFLSLIFLFNAFLYLTCYISALALMIDCLWSLLTGHQVPQGQRFCLSWPSTPPPA